MRLERYFSKPHQVVWALVATAFTVGIRSWQRRLTDTT